MITLCFGILSTLGSGKLAVLKAELILTIFLSFSDSYTGGVMAVRKPQNRTENAKNTETAVINEGHKHERFLLLQST